MISIPATPKNNKYRFDNSIFSYLLVIREILKESFDWMNFVTELNALFEEYKDNIELTRIGFPDNWHELISI